MRYIVGDDVVDAALLSYDEEYVFVLPLVTTRGISHAGYRLQPNYAAYDDRVLGILASDVPHAYLSYLLATDQVQHAAAYAEGALERIDWTKLSTWETVQLLEANDRLIPFARENLRCAYITYQTKTGKTSNLGDYTWDGVGDCAPVLQIAVKKRALHSLSMLRHVLGSEFDKKILGLFVSADGDDGPFILSQMSDNQLMQLFTNRANVVMSYLQRWPQANFEQRTLTLMQSSNWLLYVQYLAQNDRLSEAVDKVEEQLDSTIAKEFFSDEAQESLHPLLHQIAPAMTTRLWALLRQVNPEEADELSAELF
jgi:hypothetical protein